MKIYIGKFIKIAVQLALAAPAIVTAVKPVLTAVRKVDRTN